ncbi:MAG: beta-galactosidase [Propionibacteriaceae bacterium]|nr:beta-galactosidase [Propionibacteriaceae bacterium]
MPEVKLERRRIVIDGQPRIVVAGEVHYFRVPRVEWRQRLELVVEAGCNAVASYIPWLLHELPDGSLDVTGGTRSDRDVGAFIDLCAELGLWFIARPGPFIMAELKNEGIPYRIYREHPELCPVGWDGVPAPTRTLDYLAPAFLAEVRRWYQAVVPVIAQRLISRGGNVIAVQLDNEIGMLAWISNSPDLTDDLLADFRSWVRLNRDDAASRYPDDVDWAQVVRSPQERWAAALRVDLAEFMRDRFARYTSELRALCEEFGITGVPFAINVHGTDASVGQSFALGISQLVETYAGQPGMFAGSDHYLGQVTLDSATDLYVMDAFLNAVNGPDQPLTSIEFECGGGDYGDGMDQSHDPSTAELKTRLSAAQGCRLVNYYLLAGGVNRPLDEPVGDGDDRISFTGERHGTAAPIGPEGQRSATFEGTRAATGSLRRLESLLATMDPEPDNLQLGLVLDSYATEYSYPGSAVMRETVDDLTRHRGAGGRRALARSALSLGLQFDAVWLERDEPRPGAVLMLATSRYLAAPVQQRLLDHVRSGGSLLMLGRLPELDLAGEPCRILADALDLQVAGEYQERRGYYPTAVARAWAEPWPDHKVPWLAELDAGRGQVFLTDHDGRPCGVEVPLGEGTVIHLAAEVASNSELFGRALRRLGVRGRLRLKTDVPGVFALITADSTGQRLLHLVNVTGHQPQVGLRFRGTDLGTLRLAPRSGLMLPLGLRTASGTIEWADAEVQELGADRVRFGVGHQPDGSSVVRVTGAPPIVEGADVTASDGVWTVRGRGPLELRF